jgi:tetratricopeptide (TPR) repeat protein
MRKETTLKVGRNDPCPCGSGKKYKKCCMPKDEEQKSETQSDESMDITAPSDNQKQQPQSDETENNFNRASNLMEKSQFDQASRVFRMIILTDKDNYKAITGYGRCLAEMGMYEDACKYFEKALEINPDYTQASLNLAIYGK